MFVFAGLTLWTVLSHWFCRTLSKKNARKYYCSQMFWVLLLLQGLRSIYIGGVDTSEVYAVQFERIQDVPFADVGSVFQKDYLFYYMLKLFTLVCPNFNVFVFAVSVFVLVCYTRFVYKYSSFPMLSFIMYYALGYYAIGFQMLRHVLAVSILLSSYDALRKRQLIKFSLIVLLASGFHGSALVFLIAYPAAVLKVDWKQWLVIALVIAAVFVARDKISGLVNSMITSISRYSNYTQRASQLSWAGTMILLCIYAVSFFFSYPLYKTDKTLCLQLNMCVISILLMTLVKVVGEFHRISMFFGMYNTILLPNAWMKYRTNPSTKVLCMFGIIAVFAAYFLLIGLENHDLTRYAFFWSDR